MLSTQRNSRRGSTDSQDSVNSHEYSHSDRQRIAAEVDAAIAGGAMRASAFATGHQTDDKDNEVKPDAGRSGQAAASTSSRRASWRNPKKTRRTTKPKKHMGNKALIVSHRWGGPIQGGVTDAVHLLIRLLRELGLSVYCTVLTATEAEIKEAREYGVELIVPSPKPRFKVRSGTPNGDWLYFHKGYFPNLQELANVRFVFGFGMITSEAAFEVHRDLFKKTAAFYLINLFDRDVVTPVIADCEDSELVLRRDNVLKEGQDSSSVFSVGGSIFKKYRKIYRKDSKIKHYRLSPMVDENHFKMKPPEYVDEDEEFQILSLFHEHELEYLKSDSNIVKAMNSIADSFYQMKKSALKWKILGVPKRCESDIINQMNPHSKLKVILARMPSAENLNDELGQSNLVLVHPFSVHYVNLTLASMSAAVPVIVPDGSLSHELIKVHMHDYEESVVVDMSDSDKLRERIRDFLCSYNTTLKRANEIRSTIKSKVQQELKNINTDFFRVVQDDAEIKLGIILKREKSTAKKTQVNEQDTENRKTGPNQSSIKRKLKERDSGDMKVKVKVSEIVPASGNKVEGVEKRFYESDETRKKTEETRQVLDGQHDEMNVKDVGHESISYTMSCHSLDALECLMRKYENGTLQDIMENKFLSDKLLDKIGAFHLAIDVTIDYEEYYMCRKELLQKHGLPMQGRHTSRIQSVTPLMTGNTSERVNKARDLLKSFEGEGDKVTESQINMLGQLLQEKEKNRQMEYQQSLQEPDQQLQKQTEDSTRQHWQQQIPEDFESTQMTNVHQLADEEIEEKNELLESEVNKLTMRSGIQKFRNRNRGQDRDILKSMAGEGDRAEERNN
ncbi:uncharacterized protein [Ptychodera flava]|uniref:uncharacterized protein n=1 Tax=Ptychodera flava TaxID=63121 RepID=UPI003969CDEA